MDYVTPYCRAKYCFTKRNMPRIMNKCVAKGENVSNFLLRLQRLLNATLNAILKPAIKHKIAHRIYRQHHPKCP